MLVRAIAELRDNMSSIVHNMEDQPHIQHSARSRAISVLFMYCCVLVTWSYLCFLPSEEPVIMTILENL